MAKLENVKIISDESWLYDESGEVAVPFELTVVDGVAQCRCYPSAVFLDEYEGEAAGKRQ